MLLLIAIILTGCGTDFLSSGIDYKREEQGNVILLDTPNNWDAWVRTVNFDIEHEIAESPPPGGVKTWEIRWLDSIHSLQSGQHENYQKYIKYIIIQRRQAGLPPLNTRWESEYKNQ